MISFTETLKLKVVPPCQVEEELHLLFDKVCELKPLKTVLEIGVESGGTAFFWLSILKETGGTYIGVDIEQAVVKKTSYLSDRFGSSFNLVIGNSASNVTKEKVIKILDGREVDFLFIDGNHSYEGVKKDFEMYSPLVRKGGIIAFHDIVKHPPEKKCEVERFWNEIKNNFNFQEIIKDVNQN